MKKVSIIVLAVVGVLLLCIAEYSYVYNEAMSTGATANEETNHSSQVTETKTASFEFGHSNAIYNKDAFGGSDGEYLIYRFEDTDVVVFYIFGYTYLVGEWSEETKGTSYAHITQDDSQFLAMSNKYMLFLTSEGKIAVEFEEKKGQREDGKIYLFHETIPFENLPLSEQESFVYPSSFEKVEVPEEPEEDEENTLYKRLIEEISGWEFAC